ncbi:MAG: glyoxalase/bleomycin resistance protein/dioxygenase [Rhodobacteraceae bacterium]|nr:MAG: glyoxalase/bleomycin resistance protein/dioxygenase [Paracoccaceae bacterium]
MSGLPGLAGAEHVGFTVPDVDEAVRFFTDVIGCTKAYEIGPFQADDDWMHRQLGVHPRAVLRKLAMLRCQNGPNFEIFEYEIAGQVTTPPANSDVGGNHLAFCVGDIVAAVAYLKANGVTVQGDVVTMQDGPSKGLSWVYFLAPWGMQLELVSAPDGQAVTQKDPGALWSPQRA